MNRRSKLAALLILPVISTVGVAYASSQVTVSVVNKTNSTLHNVSISSPSLALTGYLSGLKTFATIPSRQKASAQLTLQRNQVTWGGLPKLTYMLNVSVDGAANSSVEIPVLAFYNIGSGSKSISFESGASLKPVYKTHYKYRWEKNGPSEFDVTVSAA